MTDIPPRRPGRPSKISPEIQARVVQAIQAGNYLEVAAAYAGLSKDTLYRWMKAGARSSSGPYREFSDAIQKALADAEVRDVALIAKAAADGEWTAAAWRLERKFPDRWGRRVRHDVHPPAPADPLPPISAIVNDPRASDLACQLLEQVTAQEGDRRVAEPRAPSSRPPSTPA